MIDLRSDTVTKPTAAMRHAMASAEVGDDVYGEDPTANRLEARAAEIFGKEAALFIPTGTMGNTIAIKLHTEHGQEVICDSRAHILDYELSMMAWFAGCVARPIPTAEGILTWEQIRAQYRPVGSFSAPTGLIEVENTHNMAGGVVYPLAVLDEICEEAHELGVPVHIDGARIFNAATYLGVDVARIARNADTVQVSLSKALGAPAGSILIGARNLIEKGRFHRKRLGGGMRQVGVLAAAGLIALEQMPSRLSVDHANAKLLAERLAAVDGIAIEPDRVQTNIVIFDISGTGMDSKTLSARLKAEGVIANGIAPHKMRMVTHYDVTAEMCSTAIDTLQGILNARGSVAGPASEGGEGTIPTTQQQAARG